MTNNAKIGALLAGALVIATPAWAEQVKTEAVITSVDGSNVTARTRQGPLTVVVSPSTRITHGCG